MNLFSKTTGSDWVSLDPPDDEKEKPVVEENRRKLERHLTDVLLAENLVVLAGLGTSRCVKDSNGNSIAPTMKDLWNAARDKAGAQFDEIMKKVNYHPIDGRDNIELLLSHCQVSQLLKPDQAVDDFVVQSEELIVKKCRFVNDTVDLATHESFLRKVARRSTRQPRMKLFTSNYDLCFESAASRSRFVVVDGFSHTQPQEFDGIHFSYDLVRRDQETETPDYIENVFQLYKIHGSVDWELKGPQVIRAVDPERPLIIFPRLSKFESSYDQPFIELMSRFQAAVRQPNTGLLVLGFGFNDNHLVQPIMSAIRSNVSLKAIVVSPHVRESKRTAIRQIELLAKNGDSRLVLVGASFEELVPLLPDLVAATEEEQHRERIRMQNV